MLGLALDVGHAFIAKNEVQIYTDSAAIGAALRLDGTTTGVNNAVAEVTLTTAPAKANHWDFSTRNFSSVTPQFGATRNGPWLSAAAAAAAPAGLGFVNVTAVVPLSLYILPMVVTSTTMNVNAVSIAGQVPATPAPFPFTPMAHNKTDLINFGFTVGAQYTMRWGAGFNGGCAGDAGIDPVTGLAWNTTAKARGSGSADFRGFYGATTNSQIIRAEIVDDYAITVYKTGDLINLTGGAKNTEGPSVDARTQQDSDQLSGDFASYTGNGRRIIDMPISDPHDSNRVLGYRAFLILPVGNYGSGGGSDYCAIYLGSSNEGSSKIAAVPGGSFKTRLVQ